LLKILVVGNYFYPEHTGGVEIVSYNLVKHYREFGCDVRWMAADVPPKYRNVNVGDVPIRSWNYAEEKLGFPSPLPNPSGLASLINAVKWSNVVHLQDSLYLINIVVFLTSKVLRKPVLITQYAKFIPYQQFYKRFLQFVAYHTIGRLMFAFADCVVAITKNVLDNMRHLNYQKMKNVVPLGVDTDFYSPLSVEERSWTRKKLTGDPNIPVILFVGRMVERKGVYLLRPLVEKYRKWHWVFVGRPDDHNPAEWNSSNLTYFQNASEQQLKELYASADVLVHPSIGEGITLVVSESLSCGTPVVISQESLHELSDQEWELFIPVRPDTNDIEKALIAALSNPGRLEEQRALCREYALNRLSWRKMARQYLEILNRFVD